jgi:hypothetical protein
MDAPKTINEVLTRMIRAEINKDHFYLELGTVDSVDETNQTFEFLPNGGGAADTVNMTVYGGTGIVIVPKLDTVVLVGYVNKRDKYLLTAKEIDKITFRNGDNGGLINIEDLTTKLNKLVDEIGSLKTALDTHTHLGVTVGAGVTGVPSPITANFTDFNKSDYEDTKILH